MNEDSDEDMIDELEDILNGNKSKKKNRKKASSTENSLKVVWHKKTPSACWTLKGVSSDHYQYSIASATFLDTTKKKFISIF